jgi:predicted pyridoxine 5'-phosphate oxidase superfamily flavin-nucleotide-binding protein
MRRIASVEDLEAIVGRPPQMVLMKQVDALDDGCKSILANAPIAGFGFCDAKSQPRTTLIGGAPGFMHVMSPTRISFALSAHQLGPVEGSGVSFVFLLPGIGETLRLNGSVTRRSDSSVVIAVEEAFVHCARSILRSGLWQDTRTVCAARDVLTSNDGTSGPFERPAVASFLASSPFVLVSSRNANGSSDASPRGDQPGFLRILDSRTLALPDRKGNRRADTFHNLLTCNRISLAALVPGRDEALHMTGTADVTDDSRLLSNMELQGKLPQAALIVGVEHAEVVANEALQASQIWNRSNHVNRADIQDLMVVGGQHLVQNNARGAKASTIRLLTRGLGAFPKLVRHLVDVGYRTELKNEGYG